MFPEVPEIPDNGQLTLSVCFEDATDLSELISALDFYRVVKRKGDEFPAMETVLNAIYAESIRLGCMTFCDDLLACIQDANNGLNEALKNAIDDAIAQSPAIGGLGGGGLGITYPDNTAIGQIINAENRNLINPENSGCNNDNIYGAVWALTQFLDQLNRDFLERISANDNIWRNLANASSAVPFLGSLPQDEVLSFIADAIENIVANYDASITQAYLRNTISCALFCIAKDPCSLDLSQVMQYFANKLTGFDSVTDTFVDLLRVSAGLGFSSPIWYDYMSYFGLAALAIRTRYLGYNNLGDVANIVRAGLNDADPDWSIFCVDCPEEEEYPTPVIAPSCAGGGAGGTNIQDLGNGMWAITTTSRPSVPDTAVTIKDINDASFILTQVSYSGRPPQGNAFLPTLGACSLGIPNPSIPLQQRAWTWANGRTDAVYFTMTFAP